MVPLKREASAKLSASTLGSSEALEARPGEGESQGQGPSKPKSPQKLLQAGVSDFTGLGV